MKHIILFLCQVLVVEAIKSVNLKMSATQILHRLHIISIYITNSCSILLFPIPFLCGRGCNGRKVKTSRYITQHDMGSNFCPIPNGKASKIFRIQVLDFPKLKSHEN